MAKINTDRDRLRPPPVPEGPMQGEIYKIDFMNGEVGEGLPWDKQKSGIEWTVVLRDDNHADYKGRRVSQITSVEDGEGGRFRSFLDGLKQGDGDFDTELAHEALVGMPVIVHVTQRSYETAAGSGIANGFSQLVLDQ